MSLRNFLRRFSKNETMLQAAVIAKELGERDGYTDVWQYRDDQIAIEHVYSMGRWADRVFQVTIEWHGSPVAEYLWESPFADFARAEWKRFNPGDWCDYVRQLHKPIQDKKTREYKARYEDA